MRPVAESDDEETWVDKMHIDRFFLLLQKMCDTILRADSAQNYNFMDSNTEADGPDMIYGLLEMYRISRESVSLDEEKMLMNYLRNQRQRRFEKTRKYNFV